ncbi:MAG: SDR family NAD(P)-dependent oxidoreductase [Desulfobacterales bacterium]|nr:SDR family NAD(P)-dependent oxidoreductase [Desulfobacterales bacterium]
MQTKTILITGATDGIGLETARSLASSGHTLLLHGRNQGKLDDVIKSLSSIPGAGPIKCYVCDLSNMADVKAFANTVIEDHEKLDVLINNAGVFKTPDPMTLDGLDVRFAVNTIAPYILAQTLLPLLGPSGRIVNLSSAAQSPVDPTALAGQGRLNDMSAYAQSKLAITMWSRSMALSLGDRGPAVIAVNPGSMLGSKMVKQAFGVDGSDLRIGADIICRAALSDEFAEASGLYFDNDSGRFASPHPDALDLEKSKKIVQAIEAVLSKILK